MACVTPSRLTGRPPFEWTPALPGAVIGTGRARRATVGTGRSPSGSVKTPVDESWEKLMEMPVVNECAVESCAYNRERGCHALAITVGDPQHAHCDTYFAASRKGGDPTAAGHVGACKMSDCRHNTDFECQAPGIAVGFQQDLADCLTYVPR